MVQGGLKKVQGGLEPPLAPHFPRLCIACGFKYLKRACVAHAHLTFVIETRKLQHNVLDPLCG